ncbi:MULTISPECIES: hypothetical protein [Cyanophyceae]|uniref:Uncharacterized protein n=1 Tax=Stenomitos frigidus AS-A4 TaxID=2933935 RepID=A0ABV0KRK7_9CYAN|nr:hypothetical protein [Phormidium sp. FACHB-592]
MTSLLHHLRDRLQTQLLTLLPAPTPTYPTINSMGQPESGVSAETIQAVMEWLFASLINAGYYGRSHLYWLHTKVEPAQNRALQHCYRRKEPVLGYRCGDRMPAPPSGYYWRLMPEHTSMQIYQLEVKDDA